MSASARVVVITVFHNSEIFFDRYVEALRLQTSPPDQVILIDSGSTDSTYLHRIEGSGLDYRLEFRENIGFCEGNNLGYALAGQAEYIFFLNPDAFPRPDYIEECLNVMHSGHPDMGAVSGPLLGFDIRAGKLTGKVDSTGIGHTWYGRFFDRDQGAPDSALRRYPPISEVTALCGASMFCRRNALDSVSADGMVFDESFYTYKEDIDLSWRLRAAGWHLILLRSPQIDHCRGWKERKDIPSRFKVLSARNEIRLYKKHRSFYLLVGLLKYSIVKLFSI